MLLDTVILIDHFNGIMEATDFIKQNMFIFSEFGLSRRYSSFFWMTTV
jgi:hypothetical protein